MAIINTLTIVITIKVHDDGTITHEVTPPPGPGPAGPVIVTIPASPAQGALPGGIPQPIIVAPEDIIANIIKNMRGSRLDQKMLDDLRHTLERQLKGGSGLGALDDL